MNSGVASKSTSPVETSARSASCTQAVAITASEATVSGIRCDRARPPRPESCRVMVPPRFRRPTTLALAAPGRRSLPCPAMATIDRPFGRHLEDFQVGDVYRHWPRETVTEYDDHLFWMITMNPPPLHTNAWVAENETVHGRKGGADQLADSLA